LEHILIGSQDQVISGGRADFSIAPPGLDGKFDRSPSINFQKQVERQRGCIERRS
jgi:hypothetical protein